MADVSDLVHRRAEIVAALAEAARAKPALVEATTHSRSTIDRGVAELLDAGLVEREGSAFRLTPTGARIHAAYESFRDAAEAYDEHRAVVDGVAPGEPLPPEVLVGAEVHVPDPEMPQQAAKWLDEEVRRADHLRSSTPVLLAYLAESWSSSLPELPVETVAVYSTGSYEAARSEYGDAIRRMVETGDYELYVTDDLPRSYSFSVAEGLDLADGGSRLYLGVHDETAALLINDEPAAVQWGLETHRALVERADRVEAAELTAD